MKETKLLEIIGKLKKQVAWIFGKRIEWAKGQYITKKEFEELKMQRRHRADRIDCSIKEIEKGRKVKK